MLKDLKAQKRNGNEITANTIRDWIMWRGSDARRAATNISKKEKARLEREANYDSYMRQLENLARSLAQVDSVAEKLIHHSQKYGPYDTRDAGRVSLALQGVIKRLQQLEKEVTR